MNVTLTAKLKLSLTPDEHAAVRAVSLAYRDALNHAAQVAFALGKTSNANTLHKACYYDLRQQYGLPAQLAASAIRSVGATYKTLWTKVKDHAVRRKNNPRIKRYRGLDHPPHFVSRTVTYQEGKDYGFKPGQRVSIQTLNGRIVVPYEGYQKHLDMIAAGAELGTAKLWYDPRHRTYYLLVSLTIARPEPKPQRVVGLDVGMRQVATTCDTAGQVVFVNGGAIQQRCDHYARVRHGLQRKGTRSATRRLRALRRRENSFKRTTNHQIAARILKHHPQSLIGIEDLTHIRDRREQRHSPHSSAKQRRANRRRSSWSFAELQAIVTYKAHLEGSEVVTVDPSYTSQHCPRCGHTDNANRPRGRVVFQCVNCGYCAHSDYVAARNLMLRTLLFRQARSGTGCLSATPEGAPDEPKAREGVAGEGSSKPPASAGGR